MRDLSHKAVCYKCLTQPPPPPAQRVTVDGGHLSHHGMVAREEEEEGVEVTGKLSSNSLVAIKQGPTHSGLTDLTGDQSVSEDFNQQ